MTRAAADPAIWMAVLLPLLVLGEWLTIRQSGYVGPALFLAGCVMALPVAARLAITPVWRSDMLVIAAGILLAVLVHVRMGAWSGTTLASQPGSVALVIPTMLLAGAILLGSAVNLLLTARGAIAPFRRRLLPLGHGLWRSLIAAGVAALAWAAI